MVCINFIGYKKAFKMFMENTHNLLIPHVCEFLLIVKSLFGGGGERERAKEGERGRQGEREGEREGRERERIFHALVHCSNVHNSQEMTRSNSGAGDSIRAPHMGNRGSEDLNLCLPPPKKLVQTRAVRT